MEHTLPDIQIHVIDKIQNELLSKIDNTIIEGLRLKGHDFETRKDAEKFITNHCRREDRPDQNIMVYYAFDKPFMIHKYETILKMPSINLDEKQTTVTASLGEYCFV